MSAENRKLKTIGTKNIANRAKKGIAWVTIGRIINEVIFFGGGICLARLLMPEDFGNNGIAAIFAGLAMRLGNLGFNVSLIQRKEISQDHLSSVLVFNFVISLILCITLVLLSPLIGSYFNSSIIGSVTAVISINFIIQALGGVPRTILQRNMEYKMLGIIHIISGMITVVVSVIMALYNYGIWSLVLGKLIGEAVRTILAILMSGWFPCFKYKHYALTELFSFGLWIFLRNQLKYLTDRADYFVIGKTLGPGPLGFYERAFSIIAMPQGKVLRGIEGVLFSTFSRIQEESEKIKSAYKKSVLSVSMISYPLFTMLIITAPSFVPIVYGEKWAPAIIPLQIMCVIGLLRSIDMLGESIIPAKGYVKAQVQRQFIFFIAIVIGCIIGIHWGINGVAAMVVFANILLVYMMLGLLNKIVNITLKDFFIPQLPALMYSIIMAIGIIIFQQYFHKLIHVIPFLELILTIIWGAIIYLTSMYIFRTKHTNALIEELREDIGNLLKKRQMKM